MGTKHKYGKQKILLQTISIVSTNIKQYQQYLSISNNIHVSVLNIKCNNISNKKKFKNKKKLRSWLLWEVRHFEKVYMQSYSVGCWLREFQFGFFISMVQFCKTNCKNGHVLFLLQLLGKSCMGGTILSKEVVPHAHDFKEVIEEKDDLSEIVYVKKARCTRILIQCMKLEVVPHQHELCSWNIKLKKLSVITLFNCFSCNWKSCCMCTSSGKIQKQENLYSGKQLLISYF